MDINAEHSMQPDEVYLDNGSTTRVDERVAQAAMEAMLVAWGNPSSAHKLGAEAARRVQRAREQVAAALGGAAAEITFTSGGTEANALALLGVAARAKHVVVSAFEHPSVADAAKALGERGVEVTTVAPDASGVVSAEAFASAVRADTALVACMWVQNEIGTVQPVDAIARAVKARAPRCHVHVDAVQALGKIAVDVGDAAFDSLAISAHKIHGPKGGGALWLKKGARVRPLVFGGGQERGLRPGTEGVPGIVALGLACELAAAARGEAAARMSAQRERLWSAITAALPTARRNGEPATSAPHILSIGFPRVPAEPLLHALEGEGVYVSAGSACHAKDKKPSPTLRAIGVPDDTGVIRLSLSRFSTDAEIARAAAAVIACVRKLQS
jgi:cysteine desulfurase